MWIGGSFLFLEEEIVWKKWLPYLMISAKEGKHDLGGWDGSEALILQNGWTSGIKNQGFTAIWSSLGIAFEASVQVDTNANIGVL